MEHDTATVEDSESRPFPNLDPSGQGSTKTLDHGSFDLVPKEVGVDDRAALKRYNDSFDFEVLKFGVGRDLGSGSTYPPLSKPHAIPEVLARPAELLGCSLQDGAETGVFQVVKAEFDGILAGGVGDLVHEALTCEVVGRGGEASV